MIAYESMLVFKPALSENDATGFLNKAQEAISQEGGQVTSRELWGRRRFTHNMGREREGLYAWLKFKASPQLLSKLHRDWTLSENLLRHMTVKTSKHADKPRKPRTIPPAAGAPSTNPEVSAVAGRPSAAA